jgi:hypothetical protein
LLVRWAQEAARSTRPAEVRGRTSRFARGLEVSRIASLFADS